MELYDKSIIDQWLSRVANQEIVIVIGAGFTRNALIESLDTSASHIIPLWNDLILAIQKKMNLLSFDSLLSFDIYKEFYGLHNYEKLLLDSMPDDNLKPGDVHNCLIRMPKVKAIITTNNIDTLLDSTFLNAYKIVKDTDISEAPENRMKIIYLHGHRNIPESWVFSRTDYDDIEKRYPLKVSMCHNLLATYPSLFLGFGYSDQDLHSIMRYVNHTMDAYKPAMLSLAISKQNDFLSDYWKKIGLSIAVVRAEKSLPIAQSLLNALKYIDNKRIENLVNSGQLPPGYRNEKSFMDVLKEEKFACKRRKKRVVLCDYHDSRKDAEIYRIPTNSGINSISAYTALIEVNSPTEALILKMHNGYIPAGSWGLMPTHREWLKKALSRYKTKKNTIHILIAGIAGLPHFVDTMSLILESVNNSKLIEVTLVDICEGPLDRIDKFLKKGKVSLTSENDIYTQVFAMIQERHVQVLTINCNIMDLYNEKNKKFDIILSHHLITTCDIDNTIIVEKYAETFSILLREKGLLISAQNLTADELKILAFQKMMEDKGLICIDAKNVFDVYDYNIYQITKQKMGMYVSKETLLAIHRKEEQHNV